MIKKNRIGGTRNTCRKEERCMQGLVGKSEGTRPLRRPRRKWEDNIKMDLQEVDWGAWTGPIWLRLGKVGGLL